MCASVVYVVYGKHACILTSHSTLTSVQSTLASQIIPYNDYYHHYPYYYMSGAEFPHGYVSPSVFACVYVVCGKQAWMHTMRCFTLCVCMCGYVAFDPLRMHVCICVCVYVASMRGCTR